MDKPTICIGIVAYDGLEGQVAEDYMRLMFHLGRRCPEYNFQLAIKSKSEQFRARNAIVRAGLQFGADYIWMLDDDHIIDISGANQASTSYDLPVKLVRHLEDNPQIGVVGALYYQRGADCFPVIMQESPDDERPFFLSHQEVSSGMQRVDITGGGCMMIRASVFDKVAEPWFEPEHEWGTDIQLCKQVRKSGWEVWCDTSLQIGHIQRDRHLITTQTVREMLATKKDGPLDRYRHDVIEYTGMNMGQLSDLSEEYFPGMVEMSNYPTLKEYYASRGLSQLARQLVFHHTQTMRSQMDSFHRAINLSVPAYGCDFGCGSAPIGFEVALRGHRVDFVDIDGSAAYEFTKWRAKKYDVNCGFNLAGPYDYMMFMDSIEHIEDWRGVLDDAISRLKPGGVILSNYFYNDDFNNSEHVSMDHAAVSAFLTEHGMLIHNQATWIKPRAEQRAG